MCKTSCFGSSPMRLTVTTESKEPMRLLCRIPILLEIFMETKMCGTWFEESKYLWKSILLFGNLSRTNCPLFLIWTTEAFQPKQNVPSIILMLNLQLISFSSALLLELVGTVQPWLYMLLTLGVEVSNNGFQHSSSSSNPTRLLQWLTYKQFLQPFSIFGYTGIECSMMGYILTLLSVILISQSMACRYKEAFLDQPSHTSQPRRT